MVNDDMMYVNHVGEMSRIMLVMLQKVVLRYLMCSVTIGSGWLDQVGWVVSSLILWRICVVTESAVWRKARVQDVAWICREVVI